ncbi:undecaprenyldiphospho-muramoylpentapeptide beta-N-acetylglucosaminyltransferase [Pseudolysobacter antarcticus]|uniref:UDP-N-acetylglucosamine--N-acetylmuramyl-(pentapeptide) pyrophosphoryl-undecaprenol N-acetylglucosamine transferase n=1 Tax=Pseudolysobacter antarcticus TaxID=2511995 RepID=A0A411HGJ6_9GAMM|nr:undecaprenyldiphospho-muramoylpentapeptide beta-N-acetylglucosaminyltransferase [Pseudolysobacter antarcticus]QBB69567.1 undecaprenyldiphospho-muramoylpentapeptide beta-N-acetylglucosaminyltransferase [Pseudolysobacter antarcticus]
MTTLTSQSSAPVLIMAGGTGGHIFPGLAVAAELRKRGVPVVWLGAAGGLETRLVPQAGIELATLRIGGIRGKGLLTMIGAPLRILRAVYQACAVLRRVRPRSVLSMGGYAAGPGGIAAWLLRRPLLVHEQNRIPGVTNRVLAKLSRKVLCGFSDAFANDSRAQWVGNPVRREISEIAAPGTRFATRDGAPRLLILGGSLGAQALNTRVPQALARLPSAQRPDVRHQCGTKHVDAARAAYFDAGVAAIVEPFIADMAEAYAWADLVICRAGALTVAELAAAGIGAVLVPFPFAVDDHQTRNGETLVAVNAALLLPESAASAERIADILRELLTDRARLLAMANAARTLAKPDAVAVIAQACIEVGA